MVDMIDYLLPECAVCFLVIGILGVILLIAMLGGVI